MTDTTSHDQPRTGVLKSAELEILRTITSGIASFGLAVRNSTLSSEEKSQVLARLAEASGSMMDATTTYLAGARQARRPEPVALSLAH
jgi:hypothetical protein